MCLVVLQSLLYMLMVFSKWRNGVPVAFIFTSKSTQLDLTFWMATLNSKFDLKMPKWHSNAFIVYEAQAKIKALMSAPF
jgi:hypothetical protein